MPFMVITWAQRLKWVVNIDIETCRECGRAVKVIACIEDPVVVEKILTHLNEKAASAGTGLLPEGCIFWPIMNTDSDPS